MSRFKFAKSGFKRFTGLVSLLLVTACQVSTPFKETSLRAQLPSGTKVIVVVTEAVVAAEKPQNPQFWKHVTDLREHMVEQPGLVGFSVRRSLFGHRAWTMTIWADEQSINQFVASPRHQEAISESMDELQAANFARFEVSLNELPVSWDLALSQLETSRNTY